MIIEFAKYDKKFYDELYTRDKRFLSISLFLLINLQK